MKKFEIITATSTWQPSWLIIVVLTWLYHKMKINFKLRQLKVDSYTNLRCYYYEVDPFQGIHWRSIGSNALTRKMWEYLNLLIKKFVEFIS